MERFLSRQFERLLYSWLTGLLWGSKGWRQLAKVDQVASTLGQSQHREDGACRIAQVTKCMLMCKLTQRCSHKTVLCMNHTCRTLSKLFPKQPLWEAVLDFVPPMSICFPFVALSLYASGKRRVWKVHPVHFTSLPYQAILRASQLTARRWDVRIPDCRVSTL